MSSCQDSYIPYESARIQNCEEAVSDKMYGLTEKKREVLPDDDLLVAGQPEGVLCEQS